MAYLEQVRADEEHSRYRLMRAQVELATAVCAGSAVLDRELFAPLPRFNPHPPTEPDGSMTELRDTMYAFASGLYAPTYGHASANQRVRYLDPVAPVINRWNDAVTQSLRATVTPAAFRRMFFEGGLWHVFVDRLAPGANLRSRFEGATDFAKLRKERELLKVAEAARPYFSRVEPVNPPSHSGSHFDAARFANAVLHIGETELGLDGDGQEELLVNSLPEIRRLTLLEMEGVNFATKFLYDRRRCRYRTEYLTIDDKRPHVGFNMVTIQDHIESNIPNVATYHHRGCPVVYQTTVHNGREIPIFSVMNETLVRFYRETGALVIPTLRQPMANH